MKKTKSCILFSLLTSTLLSPIITFSSINSNHSVLSQSTREIKYTNYPSNLNINTNINISLDNFDNYKIAQDFANKYNNVWDQEIEIRNKTYKYSSYKTSPSTITEEITKILFDSISWNNFYPNDTNESQNCKEKAEFKILSPITNINGGVVYKFQLSLNNILDSQNNLVSPSFNNGLLMNGTLSFKGFKPYTNTFEKFNNYQISMLSPNYIELANKTLDQNFLSKNMTEMTNDLNNLIFQNWSYFFAIKDGLISTTQSVSQDLIFDSSLKEFIDTTPYSESQISGPINIKDNIINFQYKYLSAFNNNGPSYSNTTISISLVDSYLMKPTGTSSGSKGSNSGVIVGGVLCLLGGFILLGGVGWYIYKEQKEKNKNGEIVEENNYLDGEENTNADNENLLTNYDNNNIESAYDNGMSPIYVEPIIDDSTLSFNNYETGLFSEEENQTY